MIKIVDLKKSFGTEEVLKGVNLDIEEGKITVILGRSGSGKTVLLKHIIGLLRPDSGSILTNGNEITAMKDRELNKTRENFGMLFQESALFDSINVWENVAFPLKERGNKSSDEIKKAVDRWIKEVGLSGMENKMPSDLSGGMKKRVGLARALVTNPKTVLFDEPCSGLDPITSSLITNLILQTHKTLKTTYIMISHNIDFTFAVADKIALLYGGKIIAHGTPSEFKKSKDPFISNYLKGKLVSLKHD